MFSFSNRLFGFYKGILPPILAETPKRAVKVSALCFTTKCAHCVQTPIVIKGALISLNVKH